MRKERRGDAGRDEEGERGKEKQVESVDKRRRDEK